jgi:hypothetical protein
VGIFRAYGGDDFSTIVIFVRPMRNNTRVSRRKLRKVTAMDTNTLLIIVIVIFLCGGFGFYGRGRWF